MFARRLLAALAALAATVALAGCGADDLSPTSIAEAADATVAKSGMKVRIDQTMTVPGLGVIKLGGDGEIDTRSQRSRFELGLTNAPDVRAGASAEAFQTEVISDHLTVYTRTPQLSAMLGPGKRWLKIDVAEVSKQAGVDISAMMQSNQDPSQALRQLKALSGEIENVGEEDVRGVSTTHYRATIDFGKYPSLVPAADRAAARSSMRALIKLTGSRTAPVEVWVGEDDLVRRFRQKMKLAIPGAATSMDQQFELYDFGTKVDIDVPDADEVADMSDVTSGGGAALRG